MLKELQFNITQKFNINNNVYDIVLTYDLITVFVFCGNRFIKQIKLNDSSPI